MLEGLREPSMDALRFDALARSLLTASRRDAASLLAGLIALGALPAEAKKRKKKLICHCDGGPRNCVTLSVTKTRGKKHLKNHPFDALGPCEPPTSPPPPPLTCIDGIRNGSETDVDCGGGCPRQCANGRGCTRNGDCQSQHCVGSTCRECETAAHCPTPDDPCRNATCADGTCGDVVVDRDLGPCNTGLLGVCATGVLRCIGGNQQCVQTVFPSIEICDGLDNNCDGAVDDGFPCPAEQQCQNGACCKVNGFEAAHQCTSDMECCSGNCVTNFSGTTTCRPAGCLPSGAICTPNCPSACCSVTSSATTCQ